MRLGEPKLFVEGRLHVKTLESERAVMTFDRCLYDLVLVDPGLFNSHEEQFIVEPLIDIGFLPAVPAPSLVYLQTCVCLIALQENQLDVALWGAQLPTNHS